MAVNIGPRIGIEGEEKFRAEIMQMTQLGKTLEAEMQAVAKGFTDAGNAQTKMESESATLNRQIENQKALIEKLKEGVAASAKETGENSEKTLKWREALAKAQGDLATMEKSLDAAGKETDELSRNEAEATKNTSTFGDMLKAKLTGEAILSGIRAVGDAIKTVGSAIFGVVKDSVQSFAELEQNIGGSEAVFGEYAATVQRTAEEAYAAMGTTQSEYLATANKMGALFQGAGLSAQQSADLTMQAMQRAADMASVMGIDTSAALEAVTGAAKGNYTMMDNLGVAMNATTLEAYRVAQGMDTAFSKMSNAEKAELAMQYFFENTTQYAGNFEREASETISGSIGMLTAAVQTWVAGLGNSEADIVNLTGNIVSAFQNVVKNIVPVVQNIVGQLPVVVKAVLPAIHSVLPSILSAGKDVLFNLIDGITSALPQLVSEATNVITSVAQTFMSNGNLSKILNAGIQTLLALVSGISKALPQLIGMLPAVVAQMASTLISNGPAILQAGIELIGALIKGLVMMGINLAKVIYDMGASIAEKFKDVDLATVGKQLIQGLWNGIMGAGRWLGEKIKGFCNDIISNFKRTFGIHSPSRVFRDLIGANLAKGIGEGFSDEMRSVSADMADAIPVSFGMAGGNRALSLGALNVTVNGTQGQNVEELADAVMFRIQTAVENREAVFA